MTFGRGPHGHGPFRHHGHGPDCGPARRKQNPVVAYFRGRMQRRLFLWFGLTILATGLVISVVAGLFADGPGWRREYARFRGFAGERFERVWDDPAQRDELAHAIARQFDVYVVLSDPRKHPLTVVGGKCGRGAMATDVVRGGRVIGHVQVCGERVKPWSPVRFALPIVAAASVMWIASGLVARRLSRPLLELARVAEDLGRGKLGSRVQLGHQQHGEIGVLADVLNDMAERVEQQMKDQRALLATVSHEIRTPLARMRLLVEMARAKAGDVHELADVDREVEEIDALVAELLAASRLDFSALSVAELDAAEIATGAIERTDVDPTLLSVETDERALRGDATLLGRAVVNLLENAKRHGGGPVSLRVFVQGPEGARMPEDVGKLAFEVEDDGPGIPDEVKDRIFEPFFQARPGESRGVGLGLSLVRRIAEAHGGRAYAENRDGRGARVGFVVTSLPPPSAKALREGVTRGARRISRSQPRAGVEWRGS